MACTSLLRKWKLLTFFVLLTSSTPSYVECSYSVRDDEGCQEMSCSDSSRSSVCTVNHSSRRCYDLEPPGRLPRPSAWMLVALLSALAGATACWLANLLAPPPGYSRKTRTEGSLRSHRLPMDTQRRRIQRAQADVMGDHEHTT